MNSQPSPAPETASSPAGIDKEEEEEEEHVMSEIHIGCPPKFTGPFISHFTFSLPNDADYIGSKYEHQVLDDSEQRQEVSLDDDGDLALPRRNNVDYIGSKYEHQVLDDSEQHQEVSLDDDGDLALPRRNNVDYIGSKYEHQVLDDSEQHQEVSLDDDGDLALPRRNKRSNNKFVVAIQHNITSSIPNVGLQVWRAALVLSDFVLHKMFTSSEFDGIVALELGAGTGLVGMLLARVAKAVFLTDLGVEILENCASNVHLNSALIPSKASVYVRELDWKAPWPPQQSNYPSGHSYAWNLSELDELERASLLVAADVIYSDDLTDALFTTLERLMSRGLKKVLYLALEKRYNFSVDDLDVVANGYSCFRSYVRDENEHDKIPNGSSRSFIGTRIDLTKIPQYANEYIRGQDVELWQIKYAAREEENQ